jgi:hypothetical protein
MMRERYEINSGFLKKKKKKKIKQNKQNKQN